MSFANVHHEECRIVLVTPINGLNVRVHRAERPAREIAEDEHDRFGAAQLAQADGLLAVLGLQGEVGRAVTDAWAPGDHAVGDDGRRRAAVVGAGDDDRGDRTDREHDDERDAGQDPPGPARGAGSVDGLGVRRSGGGC